MIMLIDDQAIVGELVQRMLAKHNDINFHYCHDPKKAIQDIENLHPTVIFLDLFMPSINGIELLKTLRKNPSSSDIPIIMLSTEDDAATKCEAFENGANDYLVKLPEPVELVARLRYHSQSYIHKLQRDKVFVALQKTQTELEKQNMALLRLSQMDGMTDIANRRYFDETILVELRRAQRNRQFLSVIMIDVDHFKIYNDTYGHLQGDDCLKIVATILKNQKKRAADLVARYGGEEFALLLPDTNLEGAIHLAENIRNAIEEEQIPHKNSLTANYVTISVGVFSCLPNINDTPETLLKQADILLYEAKKSGRNQVKFSYRKEDEA
ncbi:MAG: diguanylate cyclase [Methylococcaceae bacterium]|nr:diguanylate cyclase [Methylococcaceae bacterium]